MISHLQQYVKPTNPQTDLWIPASAGPLTNIRTSPTLSGFCSSAMTTLRLSSDGIKVIPTSCHQWDCEYCRPKLAGWFKAQLTTAAAEHSLNQFWTMTTKTDSAIKSYSKISDAWGKVSSILQRKYGTFDYVWVKSPQKSGSCHIHLLTNLEVDQEYLKKRWHKQTGSFQVKSEPIKSLPASIQYLTNNASAFGVLKQEPDWQGLKGLHIFRTSKEVKFAPYAQRPDKAGKDEYLKINMPWGKARMRLLDAGIQLDQELPATLDDILDVLGTMSAPNQVA